MAKSPNATKASKSVLWIGTNSADLSAETSWIKVGRVREMGGNLGDSWKTTDATTIDDDYERQQKTLRAGGELDLTVLLDIADGGQSAMMAAKNDGNGAPYNFKIELGDKPTGADSTPTTFKFEALVLSAPITGFSPTKLVERKFKLDIQGATAEQAKVAA